MLLSKKPTTMKNKLLYLSIFLFVSFAFADNDVFNEYNAKPDANKVTISWITKDESSIKYFIINRSTDNKASFNEIAQITKQGPGFEYQYVDENVFFKNNGIIYYRIDAVNTNGTVVETTGVFSARPNISGIFRTWGAIKAMFR